MTSDPWDWTETFSSTGKPRELRRLSQPADTGDTASWLAAAAIYGETEWPEKGTPS
jgi:hypothetical protein